MPCVSAPGIFRSPPPVNEPVRDYAPGSPERASLQLRLGEMRTERLEIPLRHRRRGRPNGKHQARPSCRTTRTTCSPTCTRAAPKEVERRSRPPAEAWEDWHRLPWEERAAVFLRAAELLAGPWRDTAERGDDARPVEDRPPGRDRRRLRADRLLALQPRVHDADLRGAADLRARRLEPDGVPAARGLRLRGHAVQLHRDRREPDRRARAHGQHRRLEARLDGDALRLLHDAPLRGGRPAAAASSTSSTARARTSATRHSPSPDLAGVHFTGSTAVFQGMWKTIGENIAGYRSYPRIVGETGGKDFIVAHPSADAEAVATAIVRGSFEYQGQKCSAASRVYAPSNLWPEIQERLVAAGRRAQVRRRLRLLELHGRRHRRELLRRRRRRRSRRRRPTPRARSWSAAATTTARATSSSRP